MNPPSKEECESWNPEQVAHFMCQKQMPECAETVNKFQIDGHRLLSLTHSDISKFSLIQQPQLQKIVQGINKNEGSLIDKLKRIKAKPGPKVPERDYPGEHWEQTERQSDESDEYTEPHEDSYGYEPPPSQIVFTHSPSLASSRDDYLDCCRNRADQLSTKATKPLPPEPPQWDNDEDYIDPVEDNQDNYIDATEEPPLITYEIPLPEESVPSGSRFCPNTQTQTLPSVSPRPQIPDPPLDTQYIDDSLWTHKDPRPVPKPLPREKPTKPVSRARLIKHMEFQSQTLPIVQPPMPPDFRRPMHPHTPPHCRILLPQMLNKQADISSMVENGLQDMDKDSDIHRQPWYANMCGRKDAEDFLIQFNRDGSFLVRRSSGQDVEQPYTLVVFYKGKVYNIPVRFIQATQQYALGREKKGEEHFTSVSRIIETHLKNPLVLIDSQSNTRDTTKLQHPVRP